MPRKKKAEEQHENAERWLLTYADMITLLMAFFIMMYSMSVLNIAKFQSAAISIRSGFGGVLRGQGQHLMQYRKSSDGGEKILAKSTSVAQTKAEDDRRALRKIEEHVASAVTLAQLPGEIQVYRDTRGVVISIAVDNLMFARGNATLLPNSIEPLTSVAKLLGAVPNNILVEGHTCPLPISTQVYPSNWELSAARACSVVRFLAAHGVSVRRMSAVGYGETHPRVPNDSERHRAMNRRVDIVVLSSMNSERQNAGGPNAAQTQESGMAKSGLKPVIPKVWDIRGKGKEVTPYE